MLGIGVHGTLGEGAGAGVVADARGPVPPAERLVERDAWVVLASVEGLGPVGFGSLLRRFGDGRTILDVARGREGAARLVDPVDPVHYVDATIAARIVEAAADAEALLDRVRDAELAVLTLEDTAAFPARLLSIELPPHLLFVRGDPAALARPHAVAVVGTRRPTESGRRTAARIAAALAGCGASVVSGLAMGVDGAAHAACVAAGVPTVAVLGSGHARLFPRAHAGLAERIVEGGGAVVSEFAPDTHATHGTFPRRNRLISGLSDATVVVEAPVRSGALITASWALEQGRECFLVPGPIDLPTSAGCLAFLRSNEGAAHLVASIPDLVEDLGLAGSASGRMAANVAELGLVERALVGELARGATTTDDLVRRTGQPVATILGALTLLEMRGLVVVAYGRHRLAGPLAGSEVA